MSRVLKVGKVLVLVAATGSLGLMGLALVPTAFGYESQIVASGSMGTAAPTGSVALTRIVDVKAISPGDVVSFRYPGRTTTITHRVTQITEEEGGRRILTTKGDANAAADPEPLRLSSGTIARVEHVLPYAGYLVGYARTPIGWAILLVGPLAGLVLDGRRRRARRNSEDKSRDTHTPPQPSSRFVQVPLAARLLPPTALGDGLGSIMQATEATPSLPITVPPGYALVIYVAPVESAATDSNDNAAHGNGNGHR